VTALPLAWFSYGARRITLTTIGFLQYVAPTLQFLLGVVVFGEPFALARLAGFVLIWLSLAIYSLEGLVARRKMTPVGTAV
jgi:chloramphenicol-sensitive protein RarD